MNMNRRKFLRSGSLALSAIGLNMVTPGLLQRRLLAGAAGNNKKMIFIFQKGGNDGLNIVIPRGDRDYNQRNRPTLFIPESEAIDSGNGFAQFHPVMGPMMEIYNHSRLNGKEGPGNLAVIHRVGYDGQSRSHFDSQQYWQNGIPGDNETEEGFIYRHLNSTLDLTSPENSFVAAAFSGSQMVALKGANTIPNFSRANRFKFPGGDKFLGHAPTRPDGKDGRGLMGLYGGLPDDPTKPYRSLVLGAGQTIGRTMITVKEAIARGPYEPENGAVYPESGFGSQLMEAALLLKRTDVRVLGLQLGGWDTHKGQGQLKGNQPNLMQSIAQGFQAIHRDLEAQWEDLIILTMTEFGRTSKENGSRGTDHAESSVMFVAGGGVQGGVYNCDASTWEDGAMFSKRGRYLARRTDFRGVFAEIFQRHFGDDPGLMEEIMPGFTIAKLDNPSDFQFLKFVGA